MGWVRYRHQHVVANRQSRSLILILFLGDSVTDQVFRNGDTREPIFASNWPATRSHHLRLGRVLFSTSLIHVHHVVPSQQLASERSFGY